eukprot:1517189-Pyramimonas_sp.AAC.3
MTSLYGSSCANNGKGALDTPLPILSEPRVMQEMKERPVDTHPAVVIGYNTGFGNTNRQLTREWLPSLREVSLAPSINK